MSAASRHLQNALDHLNIDDELDRLTNPRHTDKDALVYLPNKVAKAIAEARREIQAAIDEMTVDAT